MFTGINEDKARNTAFHGRDIKCKTMNACKKNIARFQICLIERGEFARVSSYLFDPIAGVTDVTLELIYYARNLSEDVTVSPCLNPMCEDDEVPEMPPGLTLCASSPLSQNFGFLTTFLPHL